MSHFFSNKNNGKLIASSVLVVSFVYLGLVAWLTDLTSVLNIISSISFLSWSIVIVMAFIGYYLRFARWNILMTNLGHRLPFFQHFIIYLSAFALTLTPGKIGEIVRSAYLKKWGVDYTHSFSLFFLERLIDVVVVAAMGVFIVTLFPQYALWLSVIVVSGFLLLFVFRTTALKFLVKYILSGKFKNYVEQGACTLINLIRYKLIFSVAPITVLAWATQGIALYFVLQELGYTIPMHITISLYCLSLLAGVASFIPGGLGTTEGTMIALLVAIDVDLNSATSAAIVVRGLTVWLAVVVGIVATMLISKSLSFRQDKENI